MSEDKESPQDETWGQRHGVTLFSIVLFGMLALVMFIQTAC